MVETTIFVYGQEYSENWPDQEILGKRTGALSLKLIVSNLTSYIIYYAKQVGKPCRLIITVPDEALIATSSDDGSALVTFRVEAETPEIEQEIRSSIGRELFFKKHGWYP